MQHNFIDWTLQPGCKIKLVGIRTRVKTPHSRNTCLHRAWPLWVTANQKRMAVWFDFFPFLSLQTFLEWNWLHFSAASEAAVQCWTAKINFAATWFTLEGRENGFYLVVKLDNRFRYIYICEECYLKNSMMTDMQGNCVDVVVISSQKRKRHIWNGQNNHSRHSEKERMSCRTHTHLPF